MRIHSHSSLGSFENCPRQYWYQYIGKPDVEKVDTIEAFLGTCVHETLEELYRLRLRGRVVSEEETLERFESIWEKGWSDTIRIVNEELMAEDYKRAGRDAAPRGKGDARSRRRREVPDAGLRGSHRAPGRRDVRDP
jgi:hypothetical protein